MAAWWLTSPNFNLDIVSNSYAAKKGPSARVKIGGDVDVLDLLITLADNMDGPTGI